MFFLLLRWNIHLILYSVESIRPIQSANVDSLTSGLSPSAVLDKPAWNLPATSSAPATTATCYCYSPVVSLGTVSQSLSERIVARACIWSCRAGPSALTLFLYLFWLLFSFLRLHLLHTWVSHWIWGLQFRAACSLGLIVAGPHLVSPSLIVH